MLPLLGIAALMVFGLVVLITALTYDAPVESDRPRDLSVARERRRHQRKVKLSTLARTLAHEGWPLVRHHARRSRGWLSLESTRGQLIAGAAASVVIAYLSAALV